MHIIVTGGLGHIGSYLILDLVKNISKSKITVFDNLSTNRYATLFQFAKHSNVDFIEKDLSKEIIDDYIKYADVVIHLAAITDAQSSVLIPNRIKNNNFKTTKNIVLSCSKFKTKLIFISTTSVYGSQNNLVDENCKKSELKPQSPYAFFKLKEERIILNSFKKKKLNGVILRFGTIYGYSIGMRFHTAVNKFCWQLYQKKPISVWKTALRQKRPYLSLNDASKAIIFIIKKNFFDNQIYNVVTQNFTVENIINILKLYDENVQFKFVNSKIMNQLSFEVSPNKFINKGFKFKGNMKREIFKTLKNLKK
tara:strand:+ start:12054 stop:12980 length:927 start_codon:yes stop_codon:yes gene_type:complete